MGIWQNFKEADHDFEKKFLGVLVLLPVLLGCFYVIDQFFQAIPNTKVLLNNNASSFGYFIIAFIVIAIITAKIYYRTLDFLETETITTKRACTINACIWTIYWTVWSVYCGLIQRRYPLVVNDVTITLFLLAILPGFLMFLFARNVRKDAIAQETKNKTLSTSDYEPYTICLERRYYSGYYGLLCLPIYIITVMFLNR